MVITSGDFIVIDIKLRQNEELNFNIPTGSEVKAALISPSVPQVLLGPVTLIEGTHWTANRNKLTVIFAAGNVIDASVAKLEVQVQPPSDEVKSFFSPNIKVRRATISE